MSLLFQGEEPRWYFNIDQNCESYHPADDTHLRLDAVEKMGFDQMTPVQASTIPMFMKHKDVVVEAVTGSGKTLAFVLPIIEKLLRREHTLRKSEVGALIISPTRELASQIHEVFETFIKSHPSYQEAASDEEIDESRPAASTSSPPPLSLPLLLVSGTESTPHQDVSRFLSRGSQIVIGTPGRVEEFLLKTGLTKVSVKELEMLVLDEADRLLDLGFTASLTRIISHLPKQRRTGLFSATMTDALSELVRVGLRNPVRIVVKVESKKRKRGTAGEEEADAATTSQAVSERRTPANLDLPFIQCLASEKMLQLLRILALESQTQGSARFIVYFATCAAVEYFYRDFSLHSLHGHIPPAKRTDALAKFRKHASTSLNPSVLLCTDVAARGLDLPDVDVVVQFDPPVDPKAFSHRAGRTARAGRKGRAYVLLCEGREAEYVDLLAVRRIPLRRHPYIAIASSPGSSLLATEEAASTRQKPDLDAQALMREMQQIVATDRDLHEKGAKGFVSFVKAYSKHEASYIFRLKDLDLAGVAASFGLVRLPKMPELKALTADDYGIWEDAGLDWAAYAYADKPREAKRLESLPTPKPSEASSEAPAREKQTARAASPTHVNDDAPPARTKQTARRAIVPSRAEQAKKNAAWSDKVVQKEARELRKEKRAKKRAWEKKQRVAQPAGTHAPDDDDKGAEDRMDEDDREASGNMRSPVQEDGMDIDDTGGRGGGIDSGGDEDGGDDWAEYAQETKRAKKTARAKGAGKSGGFDFAGL
ncbi:DEAD-domain-containing protein [Clavulina sp. PMI_390]|nr:DEAD-domain-containing protein [Clavulina sp. PMI_390]